MHKKTIHHAHNGRSVKLAVTIFETRPTTTTGSGTHWLTSSRAGREKRDHTKDDGQRSYISSMVESTLWEEASKTTIFLLEPDGVSRR